MKFNSLLLFLFSLSATLLIDNVAGALEAEGIVGGDVAQLGDYSYHVSLQVNGQSICGGGIIDATHIVTAAHCVTDHEGQFRNVPMKILAGVNNLYSFAPTWFTSDVQKVYIVKGFNPRDSKNSVPNDIAVLKLFTPLNLEANENLSVLKLAEKKSYAGEKAIASGFGWNHINFVKNPVTGLHKENGGSKDGKLRFAVANVLTTEECQKGYSSKLSERHICASLVQRDANKPEGICYGDSGSPLVHGGNTLIGVVSSSPIGCRENKIPAVYTRVSFFLDFINKAVKDISDDNISTTTLLILG